jgi:flagellar basal body-associated protein FliL
MSRKIMLVSFLILTLILISISADAATTKKSDVQIDPGDEERDMLLGANKNDEIDIKVTSDIPVDVYILTSDDYWNFPDPDYSNSKLSEKGVTTAKFTYKIPDDDTYYLVISNPNNITATVDYEYTDFVTEGVEDIMFGIFICIIIVILVVIVVIAILIYFAIRKKNQPPMSPAYPPPQQQYYPPPTYPPHRPPGY